MDAPPERLARVSEAVLREAKARGAAIACAESCTGGFIAALLTDVENYSHVFERGFVCYSNAAKTQMLGVPPMLIAAGGAVSEAVARAMVHGALAHSEAQVAVAITGFAGPAGPDDEEGLMHIAAARRDGAMLHACQHYGKRGRDSVRAAAAADALGLLHQVLTATGA